MSGQTKLYQRAGSPLIMGHSRYARSPWADWLVAAILSALGIIVVHAAMTLLDPARPYLGSVDDAVTWIVAGGPGILTAVAVSGIVVWFGHRAGWRRVWLTASVVGAIAGIVMIVGWSRL